MENNHYVDNKALLAELKVFKTSGKMSEDLGRMVFAIAENLSNCGNFAGYTYRDDMTAEAMLTCCKYLYKFDPEKSKNAFAYITTICKNSFLTFIKNQRKHADIKDYLYNNPVKYDEDEGLISAIDYTKLK